MSKSSRRSAIRLRGVRHNNLKNFDLDLPFNQLIVITGLSGSGKSSLAFDTLFAEGQRRYIETFSPYARQFFDRMDKPQVDSIEGIPPAIAIEQRNSVRTTRSTVGTMTEICDYMKVLWQHVTRLHCRQCGRVVRKDSPQQIWEDGQTADGRDLKAGSSSEKNNSPASAAVGPQKRSEYLITFDLPLSEKLSYEESLQLVSKQGYQRLLIGDKIVRLDDLMANPPANSGRLASLTVIQDRISTESQNRPRFVEACEQAYHFGKGKLAIRKLAAADTHPEKPRNYSNRLHCAECDMEYREPSPALFSFNNPLGACPACKGFGRIISIDYNLALPDRSKTLAGGVVKPWQTGQSAECQTDLMRMCRHSEIPVNVPFDKLPKHLQELVIEGDPEYGKDEEHQWPRAWYGIKGYFRWLESKTYKMHVRVLLSRYRCYTTCPVCHGKRLQPEALLYRITTQSTQNPDESGNSHSYVGMTLSDFYQLPIREALQFIKIVAAPFKTSRKNDPIQVALSEVQARLGYLDEVGLGYLTLDRPTRSLSGGETERVNLTACLGTRLVNTLYVLDEPSVGLHPRDTERLVGVLRRLRDTGNTVVVVEHEPSVMREADQIIDLGPGHGATGGKVVFQGSYSEILKSPRSLTGQYLSRKKEIEVPPRRPVSQTSRAGIGDFVLRDARHPIGAAMEPAGSIRLSNVSRHNLKDLSVEIPLNRFVCVTGVSGSGKTTLIREVLLPLLDSRLRMSPARLDDSTGGNSEDEEEETSGSTEGAASIEGMEGIERVLMVDQSSLGKTPRSNPAVYIGAFDDIRDLFGQSEAARKRGLASGAFSFNSRLGQCERCRGAGFEKIEMQFLSDIFIRCPVCDGRRYQQSILDVKISSGATNRTEKKSAPTNKKLSIADLLDLSIEEAIDFLTTFAESKPARRAANKLRLLLDVGLGYLKVGQPINTLSGGESQRLKLVRHLAEAFADASTKSEPGQEPGKPSRMPQNYQFERRKVSLERPRAPQTLFLFDEPTTGLHFDDVRVLLKVFQRLVDAGHSIMVVEHNLEVIKSADWVIDLGPEAGDLGGQIVVCGTPEELADCEESHTGRALRSVLSSSNPRTANRTANALA